jgi:hypothetical protein
MRAVVVAQAVIDDDRTDLAKRYWTLGRRGVPVTFEGGKHIYMGRLVAGIPEDGKWDVVNENGNKLDNRCANLRVLRRSETNLLVNRAMRCDNTSGVRGIVRDKRPLCNRWRGQVQVGGRNYATKRFATMGEAIIALRELRLALNVPTM